MSGTIATSWSASDFCLASTPHGSEEEFAHLATAIYDRVCRTDFRAPGFCLVNLGADLSSQSFRRFMVALERRMRHIHQTRSGRDLALVSAARFDQQETTKPHRDGGPDECFLMLGYEPSSVRAELSMSDYSKCALEQGISPSEFLEKQNPMFTAGERLLEGYTTKVTCFSNRGYQILFINNSLAAYSDVAPAWQGVLHTARIQNADTSLRRVVNSLMVASVPAGTPELVSANELDEFIQTRLVRRRGYDKPNLQDDS